MAIEYQLLLKRFQLALKRHALCIQISYVLLNARDFLRRIILIRQNRSLRLDVYVADQHRPKTT